MSLWQVSWISFINKDASYSFFGLLMPRQHRLSPLPELLEDDAIGETLSADADALQHAVTAQLLQHQVGVHLPSLQDR